MKKEKILISVLIALLLCLFASCGSKDGTSVSSETKTEGTASTVQTEVENGVRSYDMFIRSQFHDWIKELKWYDVAEERTGIHVNYIDGPQEIEDTYTEVDQRLASKTLPDATMIRLTQAKVYGSQGAFVDLAPYIAEYAPHIQAYIDSNPEYKAYVSDEKGRIFAFVRENPVMLYFWGYRADHFKEAGIDPASVRTVDDLTNAMRTLKAYFGKDNPNYYPLSGRDSFMRYFYLFNANAYINEDSSQGIYYGKEEVFNIKDENAYKWVETMKLWYDEGLVNPSYVEGTNTEGDWEGQLLQGNASLFYDFYNRAEWFMSNGGPEFDPDFDMRVLDVFETEDGDIIRVPSGSYLSSNYAIAVNANCDEETIRTICEFMDYFYSEEGMILANWGVEGESFKTNEDGSRSFIVDYTTEETKPAGEKKWSFLSDRLTVAKPVDLDAFYAWNTPLIAEAAGRVVKEENMLRPPVVIYTADEDRTLTTLVASVFNNEVSEITSFIVGNKELNAENWQSFIEKMDGLGLSQIEEIQCNAYRRTRGL